MKGRVLIIAGSDPSGGAGVQADIKTVTALGGYAASAITALTVQNTKGVTVVHPVAPDVIRAQIEAVMCDIGADAIKIGMIGSVAAGQAILDALAASGWDYPGGHSEKGVPLILDPVLAATSGDSLAEEALTDFIREKMLPKAYLVTPNALEGEQLTGLSVQSVEEQRVSAALLRGAGAEVALVKGGHVAGDEIVDLLATHAGEYLFRNQRIASTSTHGTGCTLASAIATGLAQDMTLEAAVERAIQYVREAIKSAPGFGGGHGPLNHAHPFAANHHD